MLPIITLSCAITFCILSPLFLIKEIDRKKVSQREEKYIDRR